MMTTDQPKALYLHVPFCRTICGYCDFTHQVYRKKLSEQWLAMIEKEIIDKEINQALTTVYIGGGTPTSLMEDQLDRLLTLLDPYIAHVEEYTMEINPETLSEEKVSVMVKHGINRVSIGFQSSDPDELKLMGRHHDMQMMKDCIEMLKKHGINDISLDLMYSLPLQTMESLKKSVDDALSLQPTHLSLYSLTIEKNTVFHAKGYEPLDEEIEADMYEWIRSYLPQYGFHQYEISNFAKGGYESKHNKVYWHYEDYYGIGAGASGKEGKIRYENSKSISKYLEDHHEREEIILSNDDEIFETLMMGLRLKEGISISSFEKRYDCSMFEKFETMEGLMKDGLLETEGDMIRASEYGFGILNSILVVLMESI